MDRKETTKCEKKIEETAYADIDSFYVSGFVLRLVLIKCECWNPKVIIDWVELARNTNQKKEPYALQSCRCLLCEKRYRQEYIFNQDQEYCESVRYDFCCGSVVNNLKERQLFSDQINKNCFD